MAAVVSTNGASNGSGSSCSPARTRSRCTAGQDFDENEGKSSRNVDEFGRHVVNTTIAPAAITTTATIETKTTTTITSSSCPANTITSTDIPTAVHYFANFQHVCVVSALLPLATLVTCFVTAYIFQYDDVHETHCRVYNIIPSISAITGVNPQIYFWRCSIAIHIGPRIPIAFIYKNYYRSLLQPLRQKLSPEEVAKYDLLINVILVLNCIEVASLGGVTYISNRENYPVHERIFITFMICSLLHMLFTIKLSNVLMVPEHLSHRQRESLKWKKILFAISILSTIGLLIFFAKHRFYCHIMAFSWFAFFEYVIAVANMLFHFTIIWDFPAQFMLVAQGTEENIKQLFKKDKKID